MSSRSGGGGERRPRTGVSAAPSPNFIILPPLVPPSFVAPPPYPTSTSSRTPISTSTSRNASASASASGSGPGAVPHAGYPNSNSPAIPHGYTAVVRTQLRSPQSVIVIDSLSEDDGDRVADEDRKIEMTKWTCLHVSVLGSRCGPNSELYHASSCSSFCYPTAVNCAYSQPSSFSLS